MAGTTAPPQVKIRGYEGQFYYTPAGGSKVIFVNVTDVNLDVKADEIDFSDHSTVGWKDKQGGLKEWSGTMKATSVQGAQNGRDFFDALVNGTTMAGDFRPQDITGGDNYTGNFSVLGYKPSSPNSGAQTIDITISGRGPLVRGTVAVAGQ